MSNSPTNSTTAGSKSAGNRAKTSVVNSERAPRLGKRAVPANADPRRLDTVFFQEGQIMGRVADQRLTHENAHFMPASLLPDGGLARLAHRLPPS